MRLPCSTIDPQGLSMSKHKLTPMVSIVWSTPGMIRVFSIISYPAVGIEPFLVSRSTTQNRGRNLLQMTSPIAWSNATNGSADFKIVLHVKLLTALRTLSQLVRCFRKTVLPILYSGTDRSTRNTQLTKRWSEVPQCTYISNEMFEVSPSYDRDIGHYKIESITSTVSGRAH